LFQAQTAECLVVGEIATDQMLVVLNKVDLLPAENRGKLVARAQKKLLQTFAFTKFKKPLMVAAAAKPGALHMTSKPPILLSPPLLVFYSPRAFLPGKKTPASSWVSQSSVTRENKIPSLEDKRQLE
jgi:hypothetical protein